MIKHRPTIKAAFKSIYKWRSREYYPKHFLQIVIRAPVQVFIFVKVFCLQYILLNHFRLMRLEYENYPLVDILFQTCKQHSYTFLKLYFSSLLAKIWWKWIKNKSYKSFLGDKEQKAVFLKYEGCARYHLSNNIDHLTLKAIVKCRNHPSILTIADHKTTPSFSFSFVWKEHGLEETELLDSSKTILKSDIPVIIVKGNRYISWKWALRKR